MTRLMCLSIGDSGIEFLRRVLSHGRVLSQLLLDRFDLQSGTINAVVPESTTPQDAVASLNEGGIASATESRRALSVWIANHLRQTPGATCIFEQNWAKPDDRWLLNSGLSYFVIDSTVFLTPSEPINDASVDAVLRRAGHYPLIGVISQSAGLIRDLSGGQLGPHILTEIVEETTYIVVDAFDGESYLVWRDR